jgi:nucleotide-binding universal stress UspA family protein
MDVPGALRAVEQAAISGAGSIPRPVSALVAAIGTSGPSRSGAVYVRSSQTTGGAIVETPFTDVLVPLDGSPAAERAMAPALELVHRTGVRLRVLSRALPDEKETLATYLAGVADRHAAVTDVDTQVVERESISDAITEGLGPRTLVCMSSHGRGGVARAVMGSVAEALLRKLDRPALIVGPHVTDGAKFAGRVVACIDGSHESERTLEPARGWAAALDLPLWLVEVGDPGPPPEWATRGDVMESSRVAGLAGRLGGVEGWDVLHDKDPAHALIGMAASATEPTALLVMATHGRTGWDRLRLGSVTTATVHAATVPVLVVSAAPQPVAKAAAEDTTAG